MINTKNQIDYILCSQTWKSSIQSAKNDLELTVAQIMSSLLQNTGLNGRKEGKPPGHSGMRVKVKVAQSCPILCDPWTIQPMEFSRPEYWSGWPFPSPEDLPNPGIKPRSPTLQADSWPGEPQGKPKKTEAGSLSLLQWMFLTQELNQGLTHWRWILYPLSYQGSQDQSVSQSLIHICIFPPFRASFPFRPPQCIEQSSLCHTAACLAAQSCLTLCNALNYSLPGAEPRSPALQVDSLSTEYSGVSKSNPVWLHRGGGEQIQGTRSGRQSAWRPVDRSP